MYPKSILIYPDITFPACPRFGGRESQLLKVLRVTLDYVRTHTDIRLHQDLASFKKVHPSSFLPTSTTTRGRQSRPSHPLEEEKRGMQAHRFGNFA